MKKKLKYKLTFFSEKFGFLNLPVFSYEFSEQ